MPVTASLADLLSSGGDGRLDRGPDGRNRYGCAFEPDDRLLPLGSCTGSTISRAAFEAVQESWSSVEPTDAARARWAVDQLDLARRKLRAHFFESGARHDVLLTPSGTDAEFVPVILSAGGQRRPVTNIVIAPDEVGSGTVKAAACSHFDEQTPSGVSRVRGESVSGLDVITKTVDVRDRGGGVRPIEQIDDEVSRAVDAAVASGRSVIVHVVAHSKTGVHAPTLDLIEELERRHGDALMVVIDAAQGRVSRRGLRASLAADRLVIFTGSKFYGGPPFSGAMILPERYANMLTHLQCPAPYADYFAQSEASPAATAWRRLLRPDPNLGLAARWLAAGVEIDRYYAIPDADRLDVLRTFEQVAPSAMAQFPSIVPQVSAPPPTRDESRRVLESKMTVLSFALHGPTGRLDAATLRLVQSELRNGDAVPPNQLGIERIETGQPVLIGDDRSVLRVALGAPAVARWSAPEGTAERRELITADLALTGAAMERAVGTVLGR